MNNKNFPVRTSVTPAELNAIVQQAHQERAQAMHELLIGLVTYFKRLAGGLRPNRARLTHSRA